MIYPIIWTLEALAIGEASGNMTGADFDKMETANSLLDKALAESDPVGASRADAQFHDVYIHRTGNPFLINILQDLKIRYRRVEVTYFEGSSLATDSVEEHRQILEALRSGDVVRSQSMIRSNWQSSLSRLKHMSGGPGNND
jgi:DNA-binding GntR family transcriptional regulator